MNILCDSPVFVTIWTCITFSSSFWNGYRKMFFSLPSLPAYATISPNASLYQDAESFPFWLPLISPFLFPLRLFLIFLYLPPFRAILFFSRLLPFWFFMIKRYRPVFFCFLAVRLPLSHIRARMHFMYILMPSRILLHIPVNLAVRRLLRQQLFLIRKHLMKGCLLFDNLLVNSICQLQRLFIVMIQAF